MISTLLMIALAGTQVALGDIWFTRKNAEWVKDSNVQHIKDTQQGSIHGCMSDCKFKNARCNAFNYGNGGLCQMFNIKVTFYAETRTTSQLGEMYFEDEDFAEDSTFMKVEQLKEKNGVTATYFLEIPSVNDEFGMYMLNEKLAQYGDGRTAPVSAPTPKPVQKEMPDHWHGRRMNDNLFSRFYDGIMSEHAQKGGYEASELPRGSSGWTPKPNNFPTPRPIQSEMPDYWHGGRVIEEVYGHASRFVVPGAIAGVFLGVMFVAIKKKKQVDVDAALEPLI